MSGESIKFNEKGYAFFLIGGILVAYLSIGISIMYSPWFSWQRNALSDLGHAVKSEVAPIFNFGLLLGGVLIIVHALTFFKEHAKYTSVCLLSSAFLLQLVATFDEVYGFLHGVVSVLFFVSICVTAIVYALEKKSFRALIAFIISFGVWVLYGLKLFSAGIAVPEIISFTAVAALLVLSVIGGFSKK